MSATQSQSYKLNKTLNYQKNNVSLLSKIYNRMFDIHVFQWIKAMDIKI